MDLTVVDAPEAGRFEGRLPDGTVAGLAAYELTSGAIVFTHTEVSPEYEGQGVASQVVAAALDSARRRGLRVVALCPYVRAYLRRHPEYGDLVGHPSHPGDA